MSDPMANNKQPKTEVLIIRNQLSYGDQRLIAKMVGCSPELVKSVLNGTRSHRKFKGRKVVEIAKLLIELRSKDPLLRVSNLKDQKEASRNEIIKKIEARLQP